MFRQKSWPTVCSRHKYIWIILQKFDLDLFNSPLLNFPPSHWIEWSWVLTSWYSRPLARLGEVSVLWVEGRNLFISNIPSAGWGPTQTGRWYPGKVWVHILTYLVSNSYYQLTVGWSLVRTSFELEHLWGFASVLKKDRRCFFKSGSSTRFEMFLTDLMSVNNMKRKVFFELNTILLRPPSLCVTCK